MITDQMIKTQFISSVVSAGIKKIQTIQQDIIRKNLNVISGDLLASVKKFRWKCKMQTSRHSI